MRISLHLGAHKTASTYLQAVLKRNGGWLAAQGHASFGPDRLRGDLRLPALNPRQPASRGGFAPLARALGDQTAAGRAVLLSEENLIGTTRPGLIAQGAQLYPQAELRLARLLGALEVTQAHLFMAVRNPPGFLISAFGQQLMAGKLITFERYCSGVDPLALRWSELVARLLALPQVAQVTLWRHEDHATVLPLVLAEMFGPHTAAGVALPDRTSHAGPSARAIEAALAQLAEDPQADPRKTLRRAMKRWPKSSAQLGPMPFDAALLTQARASYDADLAQMRGWRGVRVLMPPA